MPTVRTANRRRKRHHRIEAMVRTVAWRQERDQKTWYRYVSRLIEDSLRTYIREVSSICYNDAGKAAILAEVQRTMGLVPAINIHVGTPRGDRDA